MMTLPQSDERERPDQDSKWLAAIVEHSDDAIISKTLDGVITSWNPAAERMFGYSAAEVIGQPLQVLVPVDRPLEEPAILAGLARGELVRHFETVRVCKLGKRLEVSATISPVKDFDGNIVGASTILRDITERKQAELELQTAQWRLRALVKRLHTVREEEAKRIARELHDDLGQELTALNMEIDDLATKLVGATVKQQEQFARMHAGVDHMIDVVQKIAGELRLGLIEVLGLTPAIEWQLKQFSLRSGIACRITRLDEIAQLPDAESTALFRVLQEALTNIVRHAGATEVEVALEAAPDHVMLRIRDNGRGITAAELSDQSALGLLGMHERAQLVSGDVTISGRAGSGTTVLFRLPMRWNDLLPA